MDRAGPLADRGAGGCGAASAGGRAELGVLVVVVVVEERGTTVDPELELFPEVNVAGPPVVVAVVVE